MILHDTASFQSQPLNGDEVHAWYIDPNQVITSQALERYALLLTSDEKEQWQRFVFERHRHEYLLTRGLVRHVLSMYAEVSPAEWQFERNNHGKPEVSGPYSPPFIRFNLSHTDGLVACAVTRCCDIGIDVENIHRKGETVSIAERFFSASEVEDLLALPSAQQRLRFFEYWTLKEAYIKACGLGLTLPLGQFSFCLKHPQAIRIHFDPILVDQPESWQFELFRPTPEHILALAIRRGTQGNVLITLREFNL